MSPALIVHGGAWKIPDELWPAHQSGCRRALDAGWAVLDSGGSALEAVVGAVRVLEDDPVFDAGVGSVLNRDGYCELDAAVMEGASQGFGAVGAVRRYANPVELALRVLGDGRHCLLVGAGAEAFAAESGLEPVEPESLIIPRELELHRRRNREGFRLESQFEPGDTVGAVALDAAGHLACANSTGGTSFKLPGRIGDSCLPGCGLYAEDDTAAVCCTGWGEQIMRRALARQIVTRLADGGVVEEVVDRALGELAALPHGRAGVIGLTAAGRPIHRHNTPRMAWSARRRSGETLEPADPRPPPPDRRTDR